MIRLDYKSHLYSPRYNLELDGDDDSARTLSAL
jgi:hypothetical protein